MTSSAVAKPRTLDQISGVEVKELKTFADDRGFFREIIRNTDPFFAGGFAQWSHSRMARNTVKAWHFHHLQIDWWYAPYGLIEMVLFDLRPESATYQEKLVYYLGDELQHSEAQSLVVKIPQGVLHGCKVLSESADLFYITNRIYDPTDEGRYPFNAPFVPHAWGKESELIVTEKDRKEFIPPHPRVAKNG